MGESLRSAAALYASMQSGTFDPADSAARLMEPCVQEESYEQFMSMFSGPIVKQTPASQQQEPTPEAVQSGAELTAEALHRVGHQEAAACRTTPQRVQRAEDDVSSIHGSGCTTVSIGAGTTSSILDEGNAVLQQNVKFDNYVEDLDPDDVSDLSNCEWVDVAGPGVKAQPEKPAEVAEPTPDPPKVEAPPAGAALPSGALTGKDTVQRRHEEPGKSVTFGPEVPPPKRTYATDYPALSAEREGEGDMRRRLREAQTVSLPPGWKVDAATLKSVPPHHDNTAWLQEQAEAEMTPARVQELHSKLLEVNNVEHGIAYDDLRPLSDADVFLRDEIDRFHTDPEGAPEYVAQMKHVDGELHSTLNVPREATAKCASQENAIKQSNTLAGEARECARRDGEADTGIPATAVEPEEPQRRGTGGNRWEEEVQAFCLDPSFDYDNIDESKLTPKPMSPWEV